MNIYSPFEQFEIVPLWFSNQYLAFTNEHVFMLLAFAMLIWLFYYTYQNTGILPNRWQSLSETIYFLVLSMVTENIGAKHGYRYVPLVFLVFTLILFFNLLGMVPYSFTVTSHVIITCTLGMAIFFGLTFKGMIVHKLHFLRLFFPSDVPLWLAPLLVPIELTTYFSRALSLPIRLFANMMAGHILLKILAGFGLTMMTSNSTFLKIAGILPVVFIIAITGLELGIACLQAYVFTVLVCIYLNDVIHLH